MTIREYAKSRGVSYEATRKTIKRYYEELSEHITTQGKTRVLDDDAVSILDKHRTTANPPAIETNQQQLYIEELHLKIITLQQQVIELQQQTQQALIDATTARTALESETRSTEKLETENKQLQQELNRYQRTIFGLYRRK